MAIEPSPMSRNAAVNTNYEASKLAQVRYAEYFANHCNMNMTGLCFSPSTRATAPRNRKTSTRTSSCSSPTTSRTVAYRSSTAIKLRPEISRTVTTAYVGLNLPWTTNSLASTTLGLAIPQFQYGRRHAQCDRIRQNPGPRHLQYYDSVRNAPDGNPEIGFEVNFTKSVH